MILGTAGHIDHGKTTLVKALTGIDTDRLPEEKRRGITIDLGFAPLVMEGVETIGIVDVPGHEAFVRTMLAGASGIDIAMLVVAADEGVMPQTREHVEILSLLKIPQMIVVLTKVDLVAEEWIALVRDDVEALLSPTQFCGSPTIDVSAQSGAGLAELRKAIGAAASSVAPRGSSDDLFRMPVDRVFSVKGTGTVVTGTVWSGAVFRDSTLILRPGDKSVRVRGLQTHGTTVVSATVGERVAIALAGCDVADVGRGSVLVDTMSWIETSEMDATIEISATDVRITPRTRLRLHLGTSDVGCRIAATDSPDRHRIILEQPLTARGGDRFVLRYPSPPATIGGGRVIDPYPLRTRKGGGARNSDVLSIRSGSQSDDGDIASRLSRITIAAGAAGVAIESLPVRLGVPAALALTSFIEAETVVVGRRLYTRAFVEQTTMAVEAAILAHSANFPLVAGVSIQTLRTTSKSAPAVIDAALDRLVTDGKIEVDGSLAKPAGWKIQLGAADQVMSDSILHDICIQPYEPPGVGELRLKFGTKIVALLRALERQEIVVRVSDDRYYARTAVDGIISTLRSALEPGRWYSPAELRELIGVSRKYLIPLLEFLDRTGVTERGAGGRRVLPAKV